MGQDKVNIGKMVNKMQLFKPECSKSSTGESIVNYVASNMFLSEVLEEKSNSERIDDVLSGKQYLKFNASYFAITTDWQIEYKGARYNVDKITLLNRGLYAMYECSKNNLE